MSIKPPEVNVAQGPPPPQPLGAVQGQKPGKKPMTPTVLPSNSVADIGQKGNNTLLGSA